MSEPAPIYQTESPGSPAAVLRLVDAWQAEDDLPMPELEPLQITPSYSDLVHYAAVGRTLTMRAGYALDQKPPASVVLRALAQRGALSTKTEAYED